MSQFWQYMHHQCWDPIPRTVCYQAKYKILWVCCKGNAELRLSGPVSLVFCNLQTAVLVISNFCLIFTRAATQASPQRRLTHQCMSLLLGSLDLGSKKRSQKLEGCLKARQSTILLTPETPSTHQSRDPGQAPIDCVRHRLKLNQGAFSRTFLPAKKSVFQQAGCSVQEIPSCHTDFGFANSFHGTCTSDQRGSPTQFLYLLTTTTDLIIYTSSLPFFGEAPSMEISTLQ
ncbi:uncharacterized protein LOC141543321 isoform X2 [Sminthopsis crassicaudata]